MCHSKMKTLKLKAAENSGGKMMFIVNSEDGPLKQWVDIHVCGRGVETNSCSNGNIGKILSNCLQL